MNEPIKPKKCSMDGCDNKPYTKDRISPYCYLWVCRKHYLTNCYGLSEYEANQVISGKRNLKTINSKTDQK